ncbi:MAG: FlgD immunoglobulin-like domain containing protein [Gammaproteobacteria bacterium]
MAVDPIGGSQAVLDSEPKLQPKQLSPDDFIKLFLAQMKNQNPMHPSDSSAILQQMAEISTISASKDMQNTLNALSKSVNTTLGNSQVLEATQLIGKKVQIPSAIAPLVAEEGLSGSVFLPAPATSVSVTIKDATGATVRTIECPASPTGGLLDFKWDGKNSDGKQLNPDFYNISATAMIGGKSIPVHTAGAFTVKSVALNQKTGGVILNVDGLGGTDMGDIIKIL